MSKSLEKANREKTELGFWLYLMTDLMLFATLFATFMVLRGATADGPGGGQLFSPSYALLQTVLLLGSSFTGGLAFVMLREKKPQASKMLLIVTIGLGLLFLGLEVSEFKALLADGHGWQSSAFLTSFFTLVATHGLHITAGIIWALALLWYLRKNGPNHHYERRFGLFTIFWHFLDVIWIFIFVIVYLIGGAL